MLNQEIKARYQEWLDSPYFDQSVKDELAALTDEKEIEDRFYCDLEFGTGGMRGMLGVGTNRMNIYLIRKLTYSFGQMIQDQGPEAMKRGVAIAYDSRRFSDTFAMETALVLAACGIKAWLFESLRSTPELSFAVRDTGAIAGVMVTASHNPKEYNGYKVYWEDGAQLPPEHADKIMEKMENCGWDIPVAAKEQALADGLLVIMGKEMDDRYLSCVRQQLLHPEMDREKGGELNIVYTPLHGAGRVFVERSLAENGFSNVFTVPEQAMPDTEFSTVNVPNPEDAGAWELSLKYAKERNADLLLATDPDSDRLGVQCKNGSGQYQHLTGNQVGAILSYYLMDALKAADRLPEDGIMLQSVVSTALTEKLAESFDVPLVKVPVGFKFIGEQIKKMEETGKGTFLFGFEESLGYLKGTYARDKDAVLGAALVAEAALYYKTTAGKTLPEILNDLFAKYGYFLDEQVAYTLMGKDGKERIGQIMELLETDDRTELAGQKIVSREYYGKGKQLKDGALVDLDFPKVNILGLTFENGGFIKARPSGTEPKIRFYFCVAGKDQQDAEKKLELTKKEFFERIAPDGI